MKKSAWIIATAAIALSANVFAADPAAKSSAPSDMPGMANDAGAHMKDGDKGGKGGKDKMDAHTQMKGDKDGAKGGKDKMGAAHMKDGDKGGKGGKDKMGAHPQMKGGHENMGTPAHMKDGDKGGKGGKDKMHAPATDAMAPAAGAQDAAQMSR